MTIDTSHALFVRNAYRYATATDTAVKAKNDAAIEVSLDTNLDATAAQARADNELAANDNPRYFEIEIEGLLQIDSFVGGPVSYLLDFPEFQTDGDAMTVVSVSADFNNGRTIIGVRG